MARKEQEPQQPVIKIGSETVLGKVIAIKPDGVTVRHPKQGEMTVSFAAIAPVQKETKNVKKKNGKSKA